MSLAVDKHEPSDSPSETNLPSKPDTTQSPHIHSSKWLNRLISEKTHQLTLLGHILLSSSLITGILLSYVLMFWFSSMKQTEWLGEQKQLTIEEVNTSISGIAATPAERRRLIDQFQQIQNRGKSHASIMGFFYRNYFISLSMICAGSLIASLSLFFISKLGWERANNALINIFIIASGTAIFFGNISLVFRQEENIKDNQALYLNYFSLRNEMLSYWATQQTNAGDPIPPAKFIHYMDGRLQEMGKIQIVFDGTKITNFSDQFKRSDVSKDQ